MSSKTVFVFSFVVYLLLSYSLLYLTYKRYDMHRFPEDADVYMGMSEDVWNNSAIAPFKYRILTPLLVSATDGLPFYDTEISTQLSKSEKGRFFYFIALNYLWTVLTASLLVVFCMQQFNLSFLASLFGGLYYMVTFFSLATALIPHTGAGSCFFILALWMLWSGRRWLSFGLMSIVGVLQKETVIAAVGMLVVLDWVQTKRSTFESFSKMLSQAIADAKPLALFIPPVLVYLALRASMSSVESYNSLNPLDLASNVARFLTRDILKASFYIEGLLSHLPLLAALGVHVLLRLRKVRVDFPMLLLLLPLGLFLLGNLIGIGVSNASRVASYAFFIVIPYQLKVLESALREVGLGALSKEFRLS